MNVERELIEAVFGGLIVVGTIFMIGILLGAM